MWKCRHASRIAFVSVVTALCVSISPRALIVGPAQQGGFYNSATAAVIGGDHDDGDYDHEGYDREGRDHDGYDHEGYDREGYTRNGHRRDGHYDKNHDHRHHQGQTGGGTEQTFNPKPVIKQY